MSLKKILIWIVIIYLLMGVAMYFFFGGQNWIEILTWPKDFLNK